MSGMRRLINIVTEGAGTLREGTVTESDAWAAGMSEDDLRAEAAAYQHDNDDGSEGYFDPNDGNWYYDPAFPVSAFTSVMIPEEWVLWFQDEQKMTHEEYGYGRWDDLAETHRVKEAIVATVVNGRAYIWDGFHRVGASFVNGLPTIPAIVGKPRTGAAIAIT